MYSDGQSTEYWVQGRGRAPANDVITSNDRTVNMNTLLSNSSEDSKIQT